MQSRETVHYVDLLLFLGALGWGLVVGTVGAVVMAALVVAIGWFPFTRAGQWTALVLGYAVAVPTGIFVAGSWFGLAVLESTSGGLQATGGTYGYAAGLACALVVWVSLSRWSEERARRVHAVKLASRPKTFGMDGYANYEDLGSKREVSPSQPGK